MSLVFTMSLLIPFESIWLHLYSLWLLYSCSINISTFRLASFSNTPSKFVDMIVICKDVQLRVSHVPITWQDVPPCSWFPQIIGGFVVVVVVRNPNSAGIMVHGLKTTSIEGYQCPSVRCNFVGCVPIVFWLQMLNCTWGLPECDQCTNRIKSSIVPINNIMIIMFDKLFIMITSRVAIFFLFAKISHETWGVLRSCLNDRRSATSQGWYQGEDGPGSWFSGDFRVMKWTGWATSWKASEYVRSEYLRISMTIPKV